MTVKNNCKVGCAFTIVVSSLPLQADIGPNDHKENAHYFNIGQISKEKNAQLTIFRGELFTGLFFMVNHFTSNHNYYF